MDFKRQISFTSKELGDDFYNFKGELTFNLNLTFFSKTKGLFDLGMDDDCAKPERYSFEIVGDEFRVLDGRRMKMVIYEKILDVIVEILPQVVIEP